MPNEKEKEKSAGHTSWLSKLAEKLNAVPNFRELLSKDEGAQELKKNVQEAAQGFVQGNTTDLVGFPVQALGDALNALGVPVGPKPVGGIEWLREKTGQKPSSEDTPAQLVGSLLSPPDPQSLAALAGIFVGKKAKGFDQDFEKLLLGMKKEGMLTPEVEKDFFKETGYFISPGEGMVRKEISDLESKQKIAGGTEGTFKLEEVLDHPELFENYPALKELAIIAQPSSAWDFNASFSPGTLFREPAIQYNPNAVAAESILLHEIQHAIQGMEGFARGGNPDLFGPGISHFDKAAAATKGKIEPETLKGILYKRLAGEAEARLVQSRASLPDEARRQYFPGEFDKGLFGYDVPLSRLILRTGQGRILDRPSEAAIREQEEKQKALNWLSNFLDESPK